MEISPADQPIIPAAPVAPFSLGGYLSRGFDSQIETALAETQAHIVARLIRRRIELARAQVWAVFSSFFSIFAFVLALGAFFQSEILCAFYAAMMSSLAVGFGFALERTSWLLFWQEGRNYGLSEMACRTLYERACGADAWLDVMAGCGVIPSDEELARFVCPERELSPMTHETDVG
jgi:hypothetical protein